MNFLERLIAAQQAKQTQLAVGLAPAIDKLPMSVARYDEPFLPFSKLMIELTNDLVCAYVFHLGHYLSIGAAGAVALERALAYVPSGILKILQGPFSSPDYVRAVSEGAFPVDALTVAPTDDMGLVTPYLTNPAFGVLMRTPPNFDASNFQRLTKQYHGQLGTFRLMWPQYKRIRMLEAPFTEVDWYWGEQLYRERGPAFEESVRQTVSGLRKPWQSA